jgi:pSer/pThr/pTyr-binding forkhead associated (FHA) protein
MMPRLLVGEERHEILLPIDKTEVIIGREDPVSRIFPEVDLTNHGGEAGGVSRQHARLNQDDGQWTITDLHSTNFTHVDGVRLKPETPTVLQDGATIRFGRVVTTFKLNQ